MNKCPQSPFLSRVGERRLEIEGVKRFPEEDLAAIIREVGFSCILCGKCCTRDFNGHVLLLDEDAKKIRSIEPSAIEPPPVFDFCDQHGTLYVSGYTIRAQPGRDGACHFLEAGRCRIYRERPRICRIYPYMLHREPGEDGTIDWRQISGLNEHGEYGSCVPEGLAMDIAREVKAFECAALEQEIGFLEHMHRHFTRFGLRHVRKRFDDRMRDLRNGATITVMVWYGGSLEPWTVRRGLALPADEKGGGNWSGKD